MPAVRLRSLCWIAVVAQCAVWGCTNQTHTGVSPSRAVAPHVQVAFVAVDSAPSAAEANPQASVYTVQVTVDTGSSGSPLTSLAAVGELTVHRIPANAFGAEAAHETSAARHDAAPRAALLGQIAPAAEPRTWVFTPALPFEPGGTYEARFRLASAATTDGRPVITARLTVPKPASVPPRITAIYPTAAALCANHLRFYVSFSQPMQQGDVFEHIRLWNVTRDEEVADPFRRTELWSTDGTRLTLWLHPGRQKTGVNLNEELGAVLRPGEQYALLISSAWRGVSGQTLVEGARHTFRAVAEDHTQPNPSQWEIRTPATAEGPVELHFPKPLDWVLVQREVHITDAEGERIPVSKQVGPSERWLRLTPEKPWTSGQYRLVVGKVLEDPAGNSVLRPFEVDISKPRPPDTEDDSSETITRTFEIRILE